MSYGYQNTAAAQQPAGTFPCPRCGSPVRQGTASCPSCNTPLYGAAPAQPYPGQPTYGTTYPGYPNTAAAAYAAGGAYYAHANKTKRQKHVQEAAAGGALLALGLIITFGSMAAGGRSYILFYGPIIFGFIYLIKGLVGMAATPK